MECKWAEEAEYRYLTQASRDFSPPCRKCVLRQEFGETERCGPSLIQVKNHFHFQFDGMVSSPRTVSNLRKMSSNHDLNNSVAQFFLASQLHCVFCARQRLWRWGLKSLFANEFKINTRVETHAMGIVLAIFKGFHLCRNGCCGVFCGLRHQRFGRLFLFASDRGGEVDKRFACEQV